jgi:hypothetical protein
MSVRKETHDHLLRFKKEVMIERRFKKPELMPYQEN